MKFSEPTLNIVTLQKYESTFIYFLLKDGEVVYVGQTTKGISRPLSHTDKVYDTIKVLYCDSKDLDVLEDKYIVKYKPIYNKTHNHAVRYSLIKARNLLRKNLGIPYLTIPMVKRAAKELNIEICNVNNKYTVSFGDYERIYKYLEVQENG